MLLLAGCAAGPTGKPAQTTAAQQVLKAYHVPDLLALVGAVCIILSGIAIIRFRRTPG